MSGLDSPEKGHGDRSELANPGQVVFPENLGTILESIGVREQS